MSCKSSSVLASHASGHTAPCKRCLIASHNFGTLRPSPSTTAWISLCVRPVLFARVAAHLIMCEVEIMCEARCARPCAQQQQKQQQQQHQKQQQQQQQLLQTCIQQPAWLVVTSSFSCSCLTSCSRVLSLDCASFSWAAQRGGGDAMGGRELACRAGAHHIRAWPGWLHSEHDPEAVR